jgi:YidC/Oxa1 family membrane protein insertase
MLGFWSSFVDLLEFVLLQFAVFTGSAAIGIILFTIVARLLLLPLTMKSIRSSRKMQELQPMIKELQRKYGKEPQKLQQETVKLYQQYKINPVGGCLPMLLQLPIFIGVYQAVIHLMLPRYQENLSERVQTALADPTIAAIFDQEFLGIINLGLSPFGGEDGFTGTPYLILPVLSVVLQLTQQLMAMPRVQDPQQKAMSRAMLFMPFFFGYIAFTFPAGAVLYWVTSSLFGIIQQYFTSGWGSLANYLKFLPPDKKAKAGQLTPTHATAGSGGTVTEPEATPSRPPEPAVAQRPGFWEVLRPLTEMEATGSHTTSESTTDSATERATNTARQPRRTTTTNPRRPRRRR